MASEVECDSCHKTGDYAVAVKMTVDYAFALVGHGLKASSNPAVATALLVIEAALKQVKSPYRS